MFRKRIIIVFIFSILLMQLIGPGVLGAEKIASIEYDIINHSATDDTFIIEKSKKFEDINKPVIALALGGGGARALVNVGILKALIEEGVPVNMVTGTSMGSIIAVLFGSGLPLSQIEELINNDILPSMFDFNLPFTTSFIDTKRFNFFIELICPKKRLEDFPVPTALLSFDLTRKAKYVHTAGRVSSAIQGSYAIPLFFPVHIQENYYLIDPGIIELTPALTARILGADVVISTTAFDELPFTDYGSPIKAWSRFINIVKDNNSRKIVQEYSDIIINCDVGDYSYMDFHLAAKFVDIGYQEAKKRIPEIKRLLRERKISLLTGKNRLDRAKSEELEKLIYDIKRDRLIYDFTFIKPILYFGKDHSVFKQDLFRNSSDLQYGFKLKRKKVDLEILTRGIRPDFVESKFKFISVCGDLDLETGIHFGEEGTDLIFDLVHYIKNLKLGFGIARIENNGYFHNKLKYDYKADNLIFKNEGDIYWSLEKEHVNKYIFSNLVEIKTDRHFTIQPKLVISNTVTGDLLSPPSIYRGIKKENISEVLNVEGSLELGYRYKFKYSQEILRILQLKEIDLFNFLDFQHSDNLNLATGFGVTFDLGLLGIKPLNFGGFLAYDLNEKAFSGNLELDFSF